MELTSLELRRRCTRDMMCRLRRDRWPISSGRVIFGSSCGLRLCAFWYHLIVGGYPMWKQTEMLVLLVRPANVKIYRRADVVGDLKINVPRRSPYREVFSCLCPSSSAWV